MGSQRRPSGHSGVRRAALLLAGVLLAAAPPADGQVRAPVVTEIGPGTELENYLRLLQLTGDAQWYPWTLRAFSGDELRGLLPRESATVSWRLSPARINSRFSIAPVILNTVLNSAFPYGMNDGAAWAGRGATLQLKAGVRAQLGPLSVTFAPEAFIATNGAFPLGENGETGTLAYNDAMFPNNVDRPQRFGDDPYGRGDFGASEIRLDSRAITLGFGTAPMAWGPAVEYPFLLGTNAPGFPHAFIGTGSPLNLGIGRFHGRAIWGRLSQSAYSPVTGGDHYEQGNGTGRLRLMTGLVLVFVPRVAPTLELGLARFAHLPYYEGGINSEFFRKVWPTFLKKKVTDENAAAVGIENELASVFARWTFPTAGFELYAEHGHDDWFHDLRDLVQEPDHNKGYVIGFQKTFGRSGDRISRIRGEIVNHLAPPLSRDRPGQGRIYLHHVLRQGHTNRGQLLGSSAGTGTAAASVLAWDRYSPAGRTTLTWRRIVRAHHGDFDVTGQNQWDPADVIQALGVERSRGSARLRYTIGFDLVGNMSRNFTADVVNLNGRVGLEWFPSGAGVSQRP